MTIIDVALHKWQMLDDRRRKIIIGFTLIIIAIAIAIFFVARSYIGGEDDGDDGDDGDGGDGNHNTSSNYIP